MATLVKVNEELKAENVLLRSQPFIAPVKEEDATDGIYILNTRYVVIYLHVF